MGQGREPKPIVLDFWEREFYQNFLLNLGVGFSGLGFFGHC